MGKVHINSEKENRKRLRHGNITQVLPPKEEVSLSLEVIEKIVVKEVPVIQYIEKPIEIIKTVERIIEKPIEIIKTIEVIKEIEKIIEILVPSEPKIEIKEIEKIPNDYESLKKQNKLLKILVPIFAVVAIIGLFI